MVEFYQKRQIMYLLKPRFETTCQMPGGQPEVRKCPTLGADNIRECPAVARGEGGGGGGYLLELIDAYRYFLVVGQFAKMVFVYKSTV